MSVSLFTPTRTQGNKENLPPTPHTPSTSTGRAPRIVWSQENLHHAYSTQIRQLPSSTHSKRPQKSILKKPSLPLMNLMPPQDPVREVTPEPADPLQHPLYLNSPVSTLVASLQPENDAKFTLVDLTEAYSVLSARLKVKMAAMLEMCGPIPALDPLRENSVQLVAAFHRDIGRAFINPQASHPIHEDSPWSSPLSVGSVVKRGYTEQEVKYARDLCNLCHAAMRCFSNIALIPVLSAIFDDSQLGDILTDVLAIPLASALPTPNARKTCQIAVWTLQTQRLPTSVLEPAADRIAYALRRGIDGELGREGKKGSAADGLKAVSTLVSNQSSVFLRPVGDIMSSVFSHLTSQNLALRLQAASAVLAISSALAQLPSSNIHQSFREATSAYLTDQQNMRKSPQELCPLGKEFHACFSNDAPTHSAQSPMWALSVIAAMIVLSGGTVFTNSRTIKFILGHLKTAMAAKRTTVRATAGLVWRALVWASLTQGGWDQSEEQRETGWKIVRQILDGALGISIVATLVGQKEGRDNNIIMALETVRSMVKKGGKTCEDGVEVLERLLSVVGSGVEEARQEIWDNQKLLVEPLFQGTLLQVEWKALVPRVKEALSHCVTIRDVTPLSEAEVAQHWDALLTIWEEAVEKAPLGEDGEIPPALLNSWRALLLIQAQLTQDYEHLTSTPSFILRLPDLLKSFLGSTSLDWSLDASAPSWSSLPLKLGFVRNLWTVARNVFVAPILARVADDLLCDVLEREYLLSQNEVLYAWSALCAELVLVGGPDLMKKLWCSQGEDLDCEVKQEVWRVGSTQWMAEAGSWNGAVELLRAPFSISAAWTFDKDDLELWVRLLDCALLSAHARRVSTVVVLDEIAREVDASLCRIPLYAALPYLLSGIDASPESKESPMHPQVLLKLTNDVLMAGYPSSSPVDKSMLLAVVESLKEILGTTCKDLLVEFLTHIQGGITRCIADELEVFTDEEYNEQIAPFYVGALEALQRIPATTGMLHTLCPLLISAFKRVPEPALGPAAFKTFWIAMYKPLAPVSSELPEELKPILRAVEEVMCEGTGALGHNMSPETQTQTLETTNQIIPMNITVDSPVLPDCEPSVIEETKSVLGEPIAEAEVSNRPDTIPVTPQVIKKEFPDADPDTAMILGSSSSSSSHGSGSNATSRKRRGRRPFSRPSKRRKTAPDAGIEIITISDDEDIDEVVRELSIVVAAVNRDEALETPAPSQQTYKQPTPQLETGSPDTPTRQRKVFKAVELPTLQDLLKTRSKGPTAPALVESPDVDEPADGPAKEGQVRDSPKGWGDESWDRISPSHIHSPLPRRSHSEAFHRPSDDFSMSSSPLKQVAARRRIQRAKTMPVFPSWKAPMKLGSRKQSEEFLALEHARVVISGGVSRMGLQELLEANQIVGNLSAVLAEEMAKKSREPMIV